MKKIQWLLSLAMYLFIVEAYSQSLKWGNETPNDSKLNVTTALGYTGKSVFLLKNTIDDRYKPIKYIIERYDLPDMKKMYSKEIWGTEDGTDNGKLLHINKIYCLNEGVIVITQSHDYKIVYAMQLRTSDGLILDSRKDTLGQFYTKNGEQITKLPYKFIVSNDRSTLIGYFLSSLSPDIHFIAIDANLNIKWTFDYIPSFAGHDFDIREVSSIDGNEIGILAAIHQATDPRFLNYVTIYYNHEANYKFEVPLNLAKGISIDVAKINFDKTGNPFVAGYFKNEANRGSYGSFGFRINATTGKVISNGYTPFTPDFLSQYVSGTKIAMGDGVIDLRIQDIFITGHDDILINSERIIPRIYVNTVGNDIGADSKNHYTDLIYLKLNGKTCSSQWITVIQKKQYSSTGFEKSHGTIIAGDTAIIIFCDNNLNVNLDPVILQNSDKLNIANLDGNKKDLYMAVFTIDLNSGKLSRKCLTDKNDNDVIIDMSTFTPMSNCAFIYRGDKNKDQAGILTLHR
jgi:hypothetical protein